ncbi:MAG: glycosyltransferase [Deltaproteobacteria bacterium]|nr:glycosyltransferase [Deltaproteobacteria bacterium]
MLVSVVIPTYNRGNYIEETIASVLAQSYSNLEILIIDDFSDDATEKVVMEQTSEHSGKIRYFKNEMRKGVSGARNTGLKHARGKYIAFLDDDDLWDRSKLKVQVDLLESNKDIDALFSDASFFGDVKEGYGDAPYRKELFSDRFWNSCDDSLLVAKENIIYFLLQNGSPFRIQTFIFRRDCLDKIGLFKEDMKYYEDAEFLLRFFCVYKVGYMKQPLCRIKRHDCNTDNTIDDQKKCENEIKLAQSLVEYNEANGAVWNRKLMNTAVANAYIRMATFCFRKNNFYKARQSLMESLKIGVTTKAALRLLLLDIVPDWFLGKLSRFIVGKEKIGPRDQNDVPLHNIMYVEGATDFGGSIVCLMNLLRNLDNNKYKAIPVCLYPGKHIDILRRNFADIILLNSNYLFSKKSTKVLKVFGTLLVRISHVIQLFLIVKKYDVKLAHFNNGVYYPGVCAVKLARIPYIAHIRSLPPRLTFFSKFHVRFVDYFFSISEAVKQAYKSQGLTFKNIAVINDGINIGETKRNAANGNFQKEFNIANGEFIIGVVARLSKEKGINFLIEALPHIVKEKKNIKCFIVGDGPLMDCLKEKANYMGLAEKVIFTGKRDNPFYILSKFDIFVMPSLHEGLSLSIMEAMALGVPVIATRIGGMVELIEDGIDGILVNPASAEDISKAALLLLNQESLRRKISDNALRKANTKFSIENTTRIIDDKYSEILR